MAEDEDANIISSIEKNKAYSKKASHNPDTDYTKYAVGGESKEVPPSRGLDENVSFFTKIGQNQSKRKRVRSKN
ncbi:MAG TPA: hypothetical protein VJM74_03805 [Nitrososphaeraceae archaeon]|nr:hypothetical protein [Nitrososphaeraceae archaeon]